MREENKKLDKEISKLKLKIKNEDSGFNNKIKKNPKAGLAVGSLILAALVIGMIATFGGVGLINGEVLGKVILTGLTAGTATYMADKMTRGKLSNKLDDWFGDSDKKSLNKLEKLKMDMNNLGNEALIASTKKDLRQEEIEKLFNSGKITIGENEVVNQPGRYFGKTTGNGRFKKEEIEQVVKKLSNDKETTNLKSSLAVSLDLASTDFDKKEDVKKLLDAAEKFADGEDKAKLKGIFKVALGVDDDGKENLNNLKAISIDNRAKILKDLSKAVTDAKKTAADAAGAAGADAPVAPVKIQSTEIDKINKNLSAAISQNKEATTSRSV